MICPVCEHDQVRGVRCERCGRQLTGEGVLEQVPRLEGLEPTRIEAPDAPATPPVVGLEPSGVGGMVLAGVGPPAPCAYCATPAALGAVFCERCGMKLPVYRSARREAPDDLRCEQCAGYVRNGTCALCGARVADAGPRTGA